MADEVEWTRDAVPRARAWLEEPVEGLDALTIEALLDRIEELEADSEEESRLRQRLSELLTGVANALKGPPAELTLHDWSDLPALSSTLQTRVEQLQAVVAAFHLDADQSLGSEARFMMPATYHAIDQLQPRGPGDG